MKIKTAACLGALLLLAQAGLAADSKEFRKVVPLDGGGRLRIDTYKGTIEVRTWNEPRVEIHARIEADPDGQDPAAQVERTDIRVTGSDRSVEIESDYSRLKERGLFGIFSTSITLPYVHYRISMPATARLAIDDYKSDTKIYGLRADLALETYKGTVVIENLDGGAEIETYKGDVEVQFARFDRSSFETYKGDIEITLPASAGFTIEGEMSRRGKVDSEFEMRTHVLGEERLSASVGSGGPGLRFETYKGTIRIRKGQ